MKNIWIVLVIVTTAMGCSGDDEPKGCTQIGCEDLLTLSFQLADQTPIENFSGSVTIEGQSFQVSCTSEAKFEAEYECIDSKLRLRTASTQVQLDLRWDDSDSFGTQAIIEPEYISVQPNGEDCPPICQQATMVIQFDQLLTIF